MVANQGPILAVDPGEVRVGVAVSDPERKLALPLEVVDRDDRWVARVGALARERGVSEVLVGLPLQMSGHEGRAAEMAREAGDELAEQLGLPVTYHDERLTSAEASKLLRRSGLDSRRQRPVSDALAAAILLQAYLDHL